MYEQNSTLNNDFQTCLFHLMEHGIESHPRGTTTKELLNYNISLANPRNRVITFPARKTSTKYLLGEFIWYANGSDLPDGILPYSKFWAGLVNSGIEEGYEKGSINSNYGNRIFGFASNPAFITGRSRQRLNQWNETIDLFSRDRDTRQAIMNIHVPSDRHKENKDVPCTLTLQWLIRANALHLIVNMRSNDIIRGFTNDVFQFTMLQEAMLVNLKEIYPDLELGHYYHNAGSMHIYDQHFEMARDIIASPAIKEVSMIPMDVFNERTVLALAFIEQDWQDAGAPDDFDFTETFNWSTLTPYWQTCVLALFNKDESALHQLFNLV